MNFHVITLFPEMVKAASEIGVVGQAIKAGQIHLALTNPREFTSNVHHTVDDRPFGGGDGMVMMAEPLAQSIRKAKAESGNDAYVIHLSPRGTQLTDKKVRELAKHKSLILIASRYAGVDQRLLSSEVDEEISIGDYVLSGGEIAALVVIDAVGRQLPGVLGNEASAQKESFSGEGWLEQPQFTRPREWEGKAVPEMLMSGDHAKIALYQKAMSLLTTADRRPELLNPLLERSGEKDLIRLLKSALDLASKMTTEEAKLNGLADMEAARGVLQSIFNKVGGR